MISGHDRAAVGGAADENDGSAFHGEGVGDGRGCYFGRGGASWGDNSGPRRDVLSGGLDIQRMRGDVRDGSWYYAKQTVKELV